MATQSQRTCLPRVGRAVTTYIFRRMQALAEKLVEAAELSERQARFHATRELVVLVIVDL